MYLILFFSYALDILLVQMTSSILLTCKSTALKISETTTYSTVATSETIPIYDLGGKARKSGKLKISS